MSAIDDNWALAQTFVSVDSRDAAQVHEAVRSALASMQQPAVVRRMDGSAWVEVVAEGKPLPDVSLAVRMKLRKATPPKRGTSLEGLGWRISVLAPFDILTVEVENSVASLRFARWRRGELVRRYHFSPEHERPLRLNEGAPEAWEASANTPEFGITHDALVDALSLPGWRSWSFKWDHEARVLV